jgi:hypothetical protein
VQSIVGEIFEKIWQFRLCRIESSNREIAVVFRDVFELKERLPVPGLVTSGLFATLMVTSNVFRLYHHQIQQQALRTG